MAPGPRVHVLLLAAAASLLAAGCGGDRDDGTFVYARGKDSLTADPADATDGESSLLLLNVFDTLVRYRRDPVPGDAGAVEPALATSWEAAPDGRSTTFRLREGVRFHDGRPCDAAAVALNFERQRDQGHRFHFKPGPYSYWNDLLSYVERVTAVDPATVRFDFAEPPPGFFLQTLATFACGIVSPAALAKGHAFVARNPVGTGAFRFVSWANEEITLVRNEEWWDGKPSIERLAFVVVPDVRNMYQRLETGQAQGIDAIAFRDARRVQSDPRFVLHQVNPGLSVLYLSLNHERPPFHDVRVRRAVALAVDKTRIVRTAYEGFAVPAVTLLPPSVPGYASDLAERTRDVAAARALLAEAGAAGARVSLMFMSNPRPYVPDPDAVAAAVRDDLREIGLEVELRKQEWAVHLPALQNGEHQMGLLGWSPDVADADNYLYVLLDKDNAVKGSAQNVSFYRSEAFHERVRAARFARDPEERARLYREAQRIAFDDVALVPLVVTPRTAATLSTVKGFRLDPIASPRFAWTSWDG